MQQSLLDDDDDTLNEVDGLGGEEETTAASSGEGGEASGGGDERSDEHVPWEVRQEQREAKQRGKERQRELRDAKVVRMVLREQQQRATSGGSYAGGQATPATKEELEKLGTKKLRERAVEAGVDKDELDELFRDEDEKRDWSAVFKSLKRLGQEAYPERRLLGVATVALFLDTFVGLAIPAYFGKILDTATAGAAEDMQAIKDGRVAVTLALVGLTVTGSVFGATRDILFKVTGQRVVLRLRKRLFTHMMHQDVAFFDKTKSGELVNRLSSDVMMLKSAVENAWALFISSLVSMIATLIYLFFVSWKLTCLMFITPPIIILIGGVYGSYLERVAKATQDALAGATDSASESISGLRTVRAFANETDRLAKYTANVTLSYRLGIKVAVAGGIFGSFMGAVVGTAIGGILYYGAGLVVEGEMTAGVLTSYLIYCMALAGSVAGLVGTYGLVMTAAGANRRVFELLDSPPPAIPLSEGMRLDTTSLQCSVRFTDVCFSYPTRKHQPVLHNLSFNVQAGQKVALVGRSGCGKSTIMNLMMRFYDPTSGTISFAGHAMSELQPAWLHQNFGLVAQEPLLFGCTIAENIAFGVDEGDDGAAASAKAEAAVAKAVPDPVAPFTSLRSKLSRGGLGARGQIGIAESEFDGSIGLDGLPVGDGSDVESVERERKKQAEDEAVMAAAKMCNAHEFIMGFDEGYQTLVGERGVQLSGGQKQRVAIARAVRRNPVMLLLDEATSALDSESEHLVQTALDKLMVGRTTIIVAHRLSTVINSDVVVVLDKGNFAGCGTHDQLVRTNRVYRKLVQHQLPIPAEEQEQQEQQQQEPEEPEPEGAGASF